MAFDLVGSFRKHRQFWMVGILFVCMITFVVCGGGTEERLLKAFNWMRHGTGKAVATYDGRAITTGDLDELKKNRDVANAFMRAALNITKQNIEIVLKEKDAQLKKGEAKGAELEELKAHRQELDTVYKQLEAQLNSKPRFFDTGTKLDDLLEFVIWREEATRENVDLVEKTVKELIELEVSLPVLVMNKHLTDKKIATIHPMNFWNQKTALEAMIKVREDHHYADYEMALNALKEEFRIQIVQFALLGYRADTNPFALDYKQLGFTVRFPLTPHQLWTAYKTDLTKFDVAMLPVKAESFLADVGEPTAGQMDDLFNKYKKSKFNPASDSPGFIQPEKAKIQYVTADPEAKYYKNLAKAVIALQWTPPGFIDLGTGGLGTAVRQVGSKPTRDAALEKNYLKDQKKYMQNQLADFPYEQSPLTEPTFELALSTAAEPTPEMVAGLVGSLAVPAGQMPSGTFAFPGAAPGFLVDGLSSYQANAMFKHKDRLGTAVQEEIQRRVPVGMSLLLSAASPTPLPILGLVEDYLYMSREPTFLPFAAVEPFYMAKQEREFAGKFAKKAMEDVQTYLDKAKGKPKEFIARLNHLKEKYGDGLQFGQSNGLVDQYDVGDIKKNPGLAKLKEAYQEPRILDMFNYIEGRAGTDNKLTEDGFPKLFFDSSEPFSIASASPYVFQQWPPVAITKNAVTLGQIGQLGELERNAKFNMWLITDNRFLYWKTEAMEAKYPEKIAEVKDKVIEAWKFLEARKKAFEAAKQIALGLYKKEQTEGEKEGNYLPELQKKAAEFKSTLVTFDHASKKEKLPLMGFQGNIVAYKYEYSKIPKGVIPYPRDDMSKEVFSLFDLKEAIPYWDAGKKDEEQLPGNDEQVSKVNAKEIFAKNESRQIQILTNKPRSIYYVATVNKVYPPELKEFLATYARAKAMGKESDYYIQMARSEKALQFRIDLLKALRTKHLKIEDASAFQ